jgi:eukaryotic-like serine/threonine-protein kinase
VPSENQLLGGRYALRESIGHGGMAEVHRGRDVRLGREVAIKLLRPDLARDPAFEARFRREAHSAASLNSPAIVAVYDTGESVIDGANTPYIVMEYVDGQTLRDLLVTEGRLLPARALEITAAVCTALEQAHAAGIVHRDIKPANVMVTARGAVKVMDFGIARALTASTATMTQTSTVVGTAHYLSPEQARGEHVDARSDIYSTGCLLYELLTGAPPFTGDTAVSVAYQHVREEPTPPSSVEPEVPASADTIVLVAMAKNPADRYPTAAEMRADIERALAGEPVTALPVQRNEDPLVANVPPTTVLVREPPHKRRAFAYVMLGLATLAVFVLALVAARSLLSKSTTDINTPDVVNLSLPDARSTLEAEGLQVGVVTLKYDKAENGQVLFQSPPAGALYRKGLAVDLTVSRGIEMTTVPSGLPGLSVDEATTALSAAHLKRGTLVPRNSNAPTGQVLGSNPTVGTSVAAGSAVTLYVSNGQVPVPNVVGKDEDVAKSLLQEAGFDPVVLIAAEHTASKIGQVDAQLPAAKSFAPYGSTVKIYVVEAAPPPPTKSPSQSITPTTTPPTTPPTSPSSSPTTSVSSSTKSP